MSVLAAAVAMAITLDGVTSASEAQTLATLVREVRSADYRGARGDLERLAASLEAVRDPVLAPYRHYWRGFAQWRRAVNGFNETPLPSDLAADLDAAVASFESALVVKPDWVEAKVGVLGCVGPLLYLARDDAPRRDALLKAYLPMVTELRDAGAGNPRWLWTMGQSQLAGGGERRSPRRRRRASAAGSRLRSPRRARSPRTNPPGSPAGAGRRT